MSDNNKAQMADNAKAFLELSQKILEEAMASCQVQGFKEITFAAPMNIATQPVRPEDVSQVKIWQQINQLYASQESLFNSVEPGANPVALNENNDVQLDEINKMLGP